MDVRFATYSVRMASKTQLHFVLLIYNLFQMKHQIDATLCRFYFCRVTLHVSGVKRPSSGVFKTSIAATGTCVIVAGKSSHLLIRAGI
jgi:hypothetical protein